MAKKNVKKFNGTQGSRVRDYVPAQVRTFAETLAGKRDRITEKDFSEKELQQARDAIKASRKRQEWKLDPERAKAIKQEVDKRPSKAGQEYLKRETTIDPTVGYPDYDTKNRNSTMWTDFNVSPSRAMRNTLGRFSYEKDPKGHLIATDKYDFEDDLIKEYPNIRRTAEYEQMNPVEKVGAIALDTFRPSQGQLGTLPSRIGSAFIGKDGRPVRIDLGEAPFKRGGKVKAKTTMKLTDKPKVTKASSRGDGIAQRGKTKGRMV